MISCYLRALSLDILVEMRFQSASAICGATLVIYCISSLCTERFDSQKHAIPFALTPQRQVASNEIWHCRSLIYIAIMNIIAWLSIIFSLTTTNDHYPITHVCNKYLIYGLYDNTCYIRFHHLTCMAFTLWYDMRNSPAHLFIHLCVKSDNLGRILYILKSMHSIPNLHWLEKFDCCIQ